MEIRSWLTRAWLPPLAFTSLTQQSSPQDITQKTFLNYVFCVFSKLYYEKLTKQCVMTNVIEQPEMHVLTVTLLLFYAAVCYLAIMGNAKSILNVHYTLVCHRNCDGIRNVNFKEKWTTLVIILKNNNHVDNDDNYTTTAGKQVGIWALLLPTSDWLGGGWRPGSGWLEKKAYYD